MRPLATISFPQRVDCHATWWQWLWLLLLCSELTFRVRTGWEIRENPIDTWAVYRVALVATTALVLAVRLALRRPAWMGSLGRGLVGALTVYAAISAASTLWSSYPAWTLYKSLEYLVDIALLAAILATIRSVEEFRSFFNWTWILCGLLVTSAWLGVLFWPTLALEPENGLLAVRLLGIVPHIDYNTLGEFGAILAIVAFSRLRVGSYRGHQRAWYCLLCAMGLVTLVLSQTRSAIGGFLLGLVLVLFFSKGKATTALAVSVGVAVLSVGSARVWEFILRGQTEQVFESATGRLEWWNFAWHEFLHSPIMGAGAYTGRIAVATRLGESELPSFLNSYVEVLFGVGIVGLLPVLVAFFGTWWWLIQTLRSSSLESSRRRLAVEAIGVLSVVSVRSFITTHLISHPSLQFLVILGYAEFLRRQWRQSKRTGVRTLPAFPR